MLTRQLNSRNTLTSNTTTPSLLGALPASAARPQHLRQCLPHDAARPWHLGPLRCVDADGYVRFRMVGAHGSPSPPIHSVPVLLLRLPVREMCGSLSSSLIFAA